MRLATIPKSMANQSVTFCRKGSETDIRGRAVYEKMQIDHVVVQTDPVYSGSGNSRELVANAVVFFYARVSTPVPVLSDDDVGNKIIYKGRERTIKRIVECLDPFSNDVWAYEVEVL